MEITFIWNKLKRVKTGNTNLLLPALTGSRLNAESLGQGAAGNESRAVRVVSQGGQEVADWDVEQQTASLTSQFTSQLIYRVWSGEKRVCQQKVMSNNNIFQILLCAQHTVTIQGFLFYFILCHFRYFLLSDLFICQFFFQSQKHCCTCTIFGCCIWTCSLWKFRFKTAGQRSVRQIKMHYCGMFSLQSEFSVSQRWLSFNPVTSPW